MATLKPGKDAAYMEPRLIPDYELLPRDDSGGPEYDPYNMQFGDGGFVMGDKAHLSVSGGKDDEMTNDEIDEYHRRDGAKPLADDKVGIPSISKKRARE